MQYLKSIPMILDFRFQMKYVEVIIWIVHVFLELNPFNLSYWNLLPSKANLVEQLIHRASTLQTASKYANSSCRQRSVCNYRRFIKKMENYNII